MSYNDTCCRMKQEEFDDALRRIATLEASETIIRRTLGLGYLHDTAASVVLLYEKGREEFERVRDGKS